MSQYSLTEQADADFEAIFDYGIDNFGLKAAINYQHQMIKRFVELTDQPLLYPKAIYIDGNYRYCVCGVHTIYYEITEQNHIVIIRILRRQNIASIFK